MTAIWNAPGSTGSDRARACPPMVVVCGMVRGAKCLLVLAAAARSQIV